MFKTMNARPRLLIVDDQQDVLTALRLALTKEGIDVAMASSPAGALATAGLATARHSNNFAGLI